MQETEIYEWLESLLYGRPAAGNCRWTREAGNRQYHHHHHHHFICPIIQQYAHLHRYNFSRARQQGPTRTLTAALKRVIVTGYIFYHRNSFLPIFYRQECGRILKTRNSTQQKQTCTNKMSSKYKINIKLKSGLQGRIVWRTARKRAEPCSYTAAGTYCGHCSLFCSARTQREREVVNDGWLKQQIHIKPWAVLPLYGHSYLQCIT